MVQHKGMQTGDGRKQNMEKSETKTNLTVDAAKKSLGRVASEVAVLLMGKNRADYARHIAPEVNVTIVNASLVRISAKKKRGEKYVWHTGYPGGKREETLGKRLERKGYEDVFRKTIYGMLPANRLRARMMKNLIIEL
ncbi:MAG TPA: 50S ribosomal protein L13 [Candidatus Paceibacterota bacterium]|nr:50S ribosomal protein L13 [Candidatus Paceibacterota bacterium]